MEAVASAAAAVEMRPAASAVMASAVMASAALALAAVEGAKPTTKADSLVSQNDVGHDS